MRRFWIVASVVVLGVGIALTSCADMDQCSLGLCAPPCPAMPTSATSSTSGSGGGGGAGPVCNPRGTVSTTQ